MCAITTHPSSFIQTQSTMSIPTQINIDPAFLEVCRLISKSATKFWDRSLTSLSPTFVSSNGLSDDHRAHLTANYPYAFTDTHGTPSGQPFVYRTGDAWSKPEDGAEAYPHVRELRPVHDHPITDSWVDILHSIKAYLGERGLAFTAIMGFAWANAGDERPFCPLLLTIGVEPMSLAFDDAKTAAHYVQSSILGQAGFPDIDVAFWEFTTSFSGIGPKLWSLNPVIDRAASEFAHPFTSTLGLAIAPLKGAYYEGSGGCYFLRDKDSKKVLLLTAAHVARPPPMFPDNKGLTEKAAHEHREDIIVLGEEAFAKSAIAIESRIGKLEGTVRREEINAETLRGLLEAAGPNDDDDIASSLQGAELGASIAASNICRLDRLHSRVTKSLYMPNKRCIGFNLYADPIGGSSTADEGFTVDWAMVQLDEDAFNWDEFQGNQVYIGANMDKGSYRDLMFPCVQDRADCSYPMNGLLHIRGVVPLSEIRSPTQRNASGDPAMPVIKNGLASGTTVGWVNGLKSLVRRTYADLEFTSLETTVIGTGGRSFSKCGDSGSMILDRNGRMVALITGGGGATESTDATFATAYAELEPVIKKALPGVLLYT